MVVPMTFSCRSSASFLCAVVVTGVLLSGGIPSAVASESQQQDGGNRVTDPTTLDPVVVQGTRLRSRTLLSGFAYFSRNFLYRPVVISDVQASLIPATDERDTNCEQQPETGLPVVIASGNESIG